MGANASNGLVGCSNQAAPSQADARGLTSLNTGSCSVCPATSWQNCNAYGPEWATASSVSEGAGCKLQCKRISYSNKDLSCCYGQQSSDITKTCDPNLNYNNSVCHDTMVNWCATDANIANQKCTLNPSVYKDTLRKYCTPDKILTSQTCKNYVLDTRQQGQLDSVMASFCSQHPTDDLCCYMNSKITCPNKFDTRCTSKAAYQTNPMISTKCPDMLTCNQYLTLDAQSKTFATNVQANCGTSSGSTDGSGSTAGGDAVNNNLLYIILLIALVVIGGSGSVWYIVSSSKK